MGGFVDHIPGANEPAPGATGAPVAPPIHVEIHNPAPVAPAPAPAVHPAPAPPPVPLRLTTSNLLLAALIAFLAFFAVKPYLGSIHVPNPFPLPGSLEARAHSYRRALATTYADAWEKAADDLASGKKIAECQADLQDAWKAKRQEAFTSVVGPSIVAPVAVGDEPKDDTERAAVVANWRRFARALRGIRGEF